MSWRNRLPSKLEDSLESLLGSVDKHEEVYSEAENVSIGQIWVAMAVMNRRLERIEKMILSQRKALKDLDSDINIDRRLDESLEESLKRY